MENVYVSVVLNHEKQVAEFAAKFPEQKLLPQFLIKNPVQKKGDIWIFVVIGQYIVNLIVIV